MAYVPEPVSPRLRWLNNVGMVGLLALVLVPVYMLLNQFWQSVFRLVLLYAGLGFFFVRLGQYVRRVMHRLPAEIPPWRAAPAGASAPSWLSTHFGAAEAIRSAQQDPHYVQSVLKPRLQRLLAYRLTGVLDVPLDALDEARLAQVEPALLAYLQRCEDTGLWARYRYRRQRVDDVLQALHRLEAL
ncbi:MAG: hypothetical protein ACREOH_19880 [Candidatus Entotheonellia bacterium]